MHRPVATALLALSVALVLAATRSDRAPASSVLAARHAQVRCPIASPEPSTGIDAMPGSFLRFLDGGDEAANACACLTEPSAFFPAIPKGFLPFFGGKAGDPDAWSTAYAGTPSTGAGENADGPGSPAAFVPAHSRGVPVPSAFRTQPRR